MIIAQRFDTQISRRQLMIGATGLTFAVTLGIGEAGSAPAAAGPVQLSPWVTIAPDGTITIMSPATEMGQGSMTSIPLIFAEELEPEWSKVRVVPSHPATAHLRIPVS